jgi:probable HAF family extracellular repeat protein
MVNNPRPGLAGVATYHDIEFQGDRGWTGSWDGRTLVDIGDLTFGFTAVQAFPIYPNQALNDRGQIVGTSAVESSFDDGASHAFLWRRGVMRDLGTLGG